MLLVLDIDGTLSDCTHRQHLALGGDWDEFHEHMQEDPPQTMVLDVVRAMSLHHAGDLHVICLTGRPEQYRSETLAWLEGVADLCEGDDFVELIMRPKGDTSRDVDLKPRLLSESEWAFYGPDKTLIFEDREAVVAMWRDLGYTCFQTAQGAF
jgi:hypothetical protein